MSRLLIFIYGLISYAVGLGGLSIVAAFTFALMGRGNFIRLMSWALSLLKPFGRVGGSFTAAFGAFLIYAFI